jgi:8-oxo-dGTP pyrophosphatase MutT (NUDIX family)
VTGGERVTSGERVTGGELLDQVTAWPVEGEPRRARGALVSLRTDRVRMPGGEIAARDVVEHPGAVAVVALDEAEQVLLIRQYRHPVGRLLWEIPAGLRDVAGEPLLATAQRELWEETGHAAQTWQVLADCYTSPGILSERLRIFLARGLAAGQAGPGPQRRHEEAHLETAWVPLADAVGLVLAGSLHNGIAALGILAAYAARQSGFAALREAGVPED